MDLPDIEDGADTLRRGSALPTVTDAPPPDGVGKPAAHPAVLHHLAASSPSQPEHRHRGGAARWWLVDAVTVAFLSLLALAYARPLVEEWIVLEYFDRAGIGGYKWFATLSPLRPLGAAPTVLQWLLGGDPWGFGLGFALMLAATYLVARWAVSTHVAGAPRWSPCSSRGPANGCNVTARRTCR
jgi:hypothetical protein